MRAPGARSAASTHGPCTADKRPGSRRLAGRLQTVQLNSAPFETYTYDPNGNRLTVEKPSGTTSATYDDQDRLLTYGAWTYTYTPNGELSTKTGDGQTWAYSYDVFGNLKRVDLPSCCRARCLMAIRAGWVMGIGADARWLPQKMMAIT